MGNQPSNYDDQKEQRLNHPKMKHVKFLKNNEIMQTSISVQNEDQFYEWQSRLAKLKKFDQYYLLIPKVYEFATKGVCGSSGVLNINFDNYPYILHDEIQSRSQTNSYFNETELWYLLYGLVSSAALFKKTGSKIGDVQSKNIFLNEQGQIKISNLCSWPNEHTNYQKLILQHLTTYVAPEQLALAKQGGVDIYSNDKQGKKGCDKYICQSFSIGLTILQAAILNSSSTLYDSKQQTINQPQLTKRVQGLLANKYPIKYSKALRISIAELCQINPNDRLQAIDLFEQLKVHDSELINLKQCNIQVPPAKNRGKYQQAILGNQAKPPKQFALPNNNNNSNNKSNNNSNNNYTVFHNLAGISPSKTQNNAKVAYEGATNNFNNNANQQITTSYYSSGSNFNPKAPLAANNAQVTYPYSYAAATTNVSNNINPSYAQNYAPTFSSSLYAPSKDIGYSYSSYGNGGISSNTGVMKYDKYQSKYDSKLQPKFESKLDSLGSTPLSNVSVTSSNYYIAPSHYTTGLNSKYESTLAQALKPPTQPNKIVPTSLPNILQNPNGVSSTTHNYYDLHVKTTSIPQLTSKPAEKGLSSFQFGTGNAYLQSIYARPQPIQTPTFNNLNNISFNKNQSTNTFENNMKQGSNAQVYNFSNISSIPKEQYIDSDNKKGQSIGVFTPTRGLPSAAKSNDSSIDIIKKINDDILKSQDKFSTDKGF